MVNLLCALVESFIIVHHDDDVDDDDDDGDDGDDGGDNDDDGDDGDDDGDDDDDGQLTITTANKTGIGRRFTGPAEGGASRRLPRRHEETRRGAAQQGGRVLEDRRPLLHPRGLTIS